TCSPWPAAWCARAASHPRHAARSGYGARRRARTPRPRRTRCPGAGRAPAAPMSWCSSGPTAVPLPRVSVEEPQREAVDAESVHVLDGEHREVLALGLLGVGAVGHRDLCDVAALRDAPEDLEHQPRDRVVVLVVGELDAGQVLDLVGPQQAGEAPGPVRA